MAEVTPCKYPNSVGVTLSILFPLVSKSPPNWGVVSSTMFDNVPLAFICVCMAEVTPCKYPSSVGVTLSMLCPFVSKSPPNWGEVSSDKLNDPVVQSKSVPSVCKYPALKAGKVKLVV